jgi:hypothetical protein
MLQIYDRILASRSENTLLMLNVVTVGNAGTSDDPDRRKNGTSILDTAY